MKLYNRAHKVLIVSTLSLLMAGLTWGQQANDPQQIWLKLERELGLEQNYRVETQVQAMGMTMHSSICRAKDRTRTDMTLPILNLKTVNLMVPDKQGTMSYTLFPEKKKYFVNPPDDFDVDDFKYTIREAGNEEYEGTVCKKRVVTVTIPAQGTQEFEILFSPKQRNMPVKMQMTMQMTLDPEKQPRKFSALITFANYRFGVQPQTLFQLPANYTQVKDMQAVILGDGFLGNLLGGAEENQAAAGGDDAGAGALLRALQQRPEAKPNNNEDGVQRGLEALRGLFGE